MVSLIEDFRRFSIHDLKRLGMLYHGFNGLISWKKNGEVISTISLFVRLSAIDPAVQLSYTLTNTQEKIEDWISLHYQESNLPGHIGGYWMFICPVTGSLCRVLYMENKHFKSRKALSPGTIYKSQTDKGSFRQLGRAFDFSDAISELDQGFIKPYSKMSYRGKPTRKMRRLVEMEARYERAMKRWFGQYKQ